MIFKISRTSDYLSYEKKPCIGAVRSGDEWQIEINTLEELLELANQEESEIIVVSEHELEIYDDYRE